MLNPTNILTPLQLSFLDVFGGSFLKEKFYLSGGTALCGFYIPYRYSEDLDFFSEDEVDTEEVLVWLKSVQNQLNFRSIDIQTSFNRNLIFLEFEKEMFKTEFTYFPFPSKGSDTYKNVTVDSIEDIALNKLFTIYQNPRLRDYMDLYMISREKEISFETLRKEAKVKFDWHIDPIQLGTQLLRVSEKKDVPILVGDFDYLGMEAFFKEVATSFGSDILKT